jgi:hypothetical protein
LERGIRGKTNRSRGEKRRVLTLTRIMLHHHKIFGEGIQKGKEIVRIKEEQPPPLFCPSWERAFKGGFEMETHHSNAHLSIYGMGDTTAFMIKEDVPAFMLGDGMGDASAFVIKEEAPLAICVSFTCIIRDAQ